MAAETNQAGYNPPKDDTSSGGSQGPNHDDADLAQQESVVNINNRNVRLTFWCMVIFILATGFWRSAVRNQTYYSEDYLSYYLSDTAPDPSALQLDQQEEYETLYGLAIAAHTILWIASTVFLSSLYISFCNYGDIMNKISAVLFVVGGGLLLGPLVKLIELNCENLVDDDAESNCNMNYVAMYIPIITVVFFIAIDIIKEVGKDIKIRLIVFCVMIAVRDLLYLLYYSYLLDQMEEAEEILIAAGVESGYAYTTTQKATYYDYRWRMSWYCIMMIFCVAIVVLILAKFQLSNPLLPKIIGFVMLFAHGAVESGLLVSAVVMLVVYDIQYFW